MASVVPESAGITHASGPQGRPTPRPTARGAPRVRPASKAEAAAVPLTGRRLGDVLVAGAALLVTLLILAPLAPWVVDLLVGANIAASVLIMFVATYTTDPLQFSVFPSVLLMGTVFRLAVNVALTRLILLQGSAGALVGAFGTVVMGGNPIVGFVLFLIVMIVQFVVISSGAGRIAEVAARFTLDAMPGKQMAIDADLNAGVITEDVARARRRAIEQQADFYGAMDGASKFVRGDAVASAVIVLIDLVGGIAIAAFMRGMALGDAAQSLTVLTVGAGLAVQVPALLMSMASGLLVTRAASRDELGAEAVSQITARPQALALAGVMVGVIALIPGMPKLVFFVFAAGLAAAAMIRRRPARAPAAALATPHDLGSVQAMESLLVVEPIELLLAPALATLATQGDLAERMVLARRQVTQQLGLLVPTIRIRDVGTLATRTYAVTVWGAEVARGEVYPDRLMAIPTGPVQAPVDGIPGKDPTFGGPATWVSPAARAEVERAGYLVVAPTVVLATHMVELLRKHAPELMTRQATRDLVERLRGQHGVLLDEVVPKVVPLGTLQRVLQGLLAEQVPVRSLARIVEAVADGATAGHKDTADLVELVRRQLGPALWQPYLQADRKLPVLMLDPAVQDQFRQAQEQRKPFLGLKLNEVNAFADHLLAARSAAASRGASPVLLVTGTIRGVLRRLVAPRIPGLPVVAVEELSPDVGLAPYGMVGLS